ncbi:uncharacterized protein M421DRAFT_386980 [Didymella exigua CBS 183.55]|uniref:Uncharacterized protein n=1 Tax=Didymella exigua CBS 183.55 TaxID=1150837 RepID=A0A6A5RV93_9PLEO|nr:uncharacterized protein M421DRAFT_386980 [Didymella exigua CBS 183.55]KAF1930206.1 hypothetical protein M421DRAFT_386980 [Didymella exigua CBS 183.55]
MDTLPRELLDAVLQHLVEHDFTFSARYEVLDDASRQAILAARLVAHSFHESKTLKDLFVAVLEETPFHWYGNQMPRLVKVSRSKIAGQMSTLSLCSMNFGPWDHHNNAVLGSGRSILAASRTDLTNILRRFANVKHLRYYTISPKCFRETFCGHKSAYDVGPEPQWGYPADDKNIHSWLFRQQDPSWVCGHTMDNVVDAGLPMESVAFPLFGNRASYCAIQVTAAFFPAALKHLTISLTQRFEEVPLFEPWLRSLRSLTFLEVAVSRHPLSLSPWGSFASCRELTNVEAPTSRDQLPRLEEFRLMSDNQNCFNERGFLLALALFPNLRRLGFAHILIKSQLNNASSWESFVKQLVPKALDRLWLLEPRNLWIKGMGQAGRYVMEKYKPDDSFRAAARNVRLMDTNSLWVKDSAPPKRRDFDYPGFAIF